MTISRVRYTHVYVLPAEPIPAKLAAIALGNREGANKFIGFIRAGEEDSEAAQRTLSVLMNDLKVFINRGLLIKEYRQPSAATHPAPTPEAFIIIPRSSQARIVSKGGVTEPEYVATREQTDAQRASAICERVLPMIIDFYIRQHPQVYTIKADVFDLIRREYPNKKARFLQRKEFDRHWNSLIETNDIRKSYMGKKGARKKGLNIAEFKFETPNSGILSA